MPAGNLYLSAITEAELVYGVEKLPEEANLRTLVTAMLLDFQIAPWDSACARQYGSLAAAQERLGLPLGQLATMIASHALAHGFTLVTNDRDFLRIPGFRVENWTRGPQPA